MTISRESPATRTSAAIRALPIACACLCATTACGGLDDPRVAVPNGDPARGRILVETYGCGTCHTIPAVPNARAVAGPPLRGIADRAYIGGVLPNTADAMVLWLQDPPAVTPRTMMPDMDVSEADARHMAAYLFTLRAQSMLVRMLRGFVERAIGRRIADPAGTVPAARGDGANPRGEARR